MEADAGKEDGLIPIAGGQFGAVVFFALIPFISNGEELVSLLQLRITRKQWPSSMRSFMDERGDKMTAAAWIGGSETKKPP